ncbi:RNA-binding domain-containing protein [Lojkania enalia]|uniref:RNA-binding domain-containing protein n=1 Tax=Lojkania enalia TaxID=147567 RepID=A0A9P4TQ27_9PLEO|nr:RNA-binding domain-containing protein [Didymosphaeria enalia]
MYLLRRTAARALTSAPSKAVFAKPRSIATFTPVTREPRKQQQWVALSFQRRFVSEDATKAGSEETFARTATEAPLDETVTPVSQAPEAAPAPEAPESATTTSAASGIDALAGGADSRTPSGLNKTVYVGNLYYEVGEEPLKRIFSRFGELNDVRVIRDSRGLSRGFAYVEFKNIDDAQSAIENLDMQVFEGRNLVVQFHRQRFNRLDSGRAKEPNPPSKTLFIGNMSFEMSDKDLNDLFRDIRNVMDVRVAIDRRTGQPRGFAHADFIDVPSATKAKAILEQKVIYGRQLRVDFSSSTTQSQRSRLQDTVQA